MYSIYPAVEEGITITRRRAARAGVEGVDRAGVLRGLVRRQRGRGARVHGLDGRQGGGAWRATMFAGPGRREIHWKGE